MSLLLPCSMAEYAGSKWYKRLLTGEYRIMMDGGAGHESIHDYTLSGIESQDPRIGAYHREIRELFSIEGKNWALKSPFTLLSELRALRARHFDAGELDFTCLNSNHRPEEAWISPGQEADVREHLKGAKGLLVIPDTERPWLAKPLIEAVNKEFSLPPSLHIALGPALTDWPATLTAESFSELPHWGALTQEFLDPILEGKTFAVVCADLRYCYALLSLGVPFISLLDSSDWFAAVLHGDNCDSDDALEWPPASGYEAILHRTGPVKTGYRYSLWNKTRSLEGLSGVTPPDPGPRDLPFWLESLRSEGRVHHKARFFRETSGDRWLEGEIPGPEALHAALFLMESPGLRVEPLFFNTMSSPSSVDTPEPSLLCSFNYYMTDNLLEWYGIDEQPALGWRRFFLDYLYISGKDGFFESPPLYSKTLLGATRQGRLIAGTFSWESISLFAGEGERLMRFDREDINPAAAEGGGPGLYLPGGGPGRVGEGLFCTVFIHDTVWYRKKGPVPIPPFGAVAVTKEPLPQRDRYRWSVEWADLPCAKEDLSWLAGGFNALVLNGKNQCRNVEEAARRLEEEGWTNPLSRQTQETQLEAAEVQPRCCIGWTKKQRVFLMVVSGRSRMSRGARFSDLASLAEQAVAEWEDELDFLVNLDGGASAMVCAHWKEDCRLLSYPSPSDNNPAGVPRKVPALLQLSFGSRNE